MSHDACFVTSNVWCVGSYIAPDGMTQGFAILLAALFFVLGFVGFVGRKP